jgi:hypothetical protein
MQTSRPTGSGSSTTRLCPMMCMASSSSHPARLEGGLPQRPWPTVEPSTILEVSELHDGPAARRRGMAGFMPGVWK